MSDKDNWNGEEKAIFTAHGSSNHSNRDRIKNDYYATDPSAIDDLFRVENFSDKIWEPACGEGYLSKRMEKKGKDVFSTDLINRGFGDDFFDFLKCSKDWDGDIITNPPYKYAKEFVQKALNVVEEGNKVAFFMKITFLESEGRIELFEKHPPKKIWVYSYRKPVARNGNPEEFNTSSAVCYAWFVWQKGYKDYPKVGWITKNGELEFVEDNKLEAFE